MGKMMTIQQLARQTQPKHNTHTPMPTPDEEYMPPVPESDVTEFATDNNASLNPSNVLQLQRQFGNHATMNIINRQPIKKSHTSDLSKFTGLKMVTPTIQREPKDDDAPDKDDAKSADKSNPDDAVELDGADNEVQQESAEIDQTINEAQQLSNIKLADGATWSTAEDYDPDDEESQIYIEDHDPVGPQDDDDNGIKIVKNAKAQMNPNAVSIDDDNDDDHAASWVNGSQLTTIAQKQKHKQKQGMAIKGHSLSAESPTDAISMGAIDVGRNVNTTIDAAEAGVAIKSASSLKDALAGITDTTTDVGAGGIVGKLQKFLGFLNVPPINILLSIGTLIFRIHQVVMKNKQMKAFKSLMEKSGGDTKLRKDALKDKAAIGSYAYAKTKRGFWLRVAKAAINAGEIIARMITLLSGGSAALVSEATAVAMGLSNGIIKVGQSLKGVYKMIMGKRGKRRLESANWIVDGAIDGDKDLAQLLLDLDVVSGIWLERRRFILTKNNKPGADKEYIKKLHKLTLIPTTTDSMQAYLQLLEEVDGLVPFKSRVSGMTKST